MMWNNILPTHYRIEIFQILFFFILFPVVQSINVILELMNGYVENRELTLNHRCEEIIICLGNEMKWEKTCKDVLWALAGCVALLQEWSIESDLKWANTFEKILKLSQYGFKCARERFLEKSLVTKERILAAKLVISSKILEKLTNPNDAVLCCLQILQQLHDQPDIQGLFRVEAPGMASIERPVLSSMKKKSPTAEQRKFSFEAASVKDMNKTLFEYARRFIKPAPTVQDWSATIKLDKKYFNPLEEESDFDDGITEHSVLIFEITGNRYICMCSKHLLFHLFIIYYYFVSVSVSINGCYSSHQQF